MSLGRGTPAMMMSVTAACAVVVAFAGACAAVSGLSDDYHLAVDDAGADALAAAEASFDAGLDANLAEAAPPDASVATDGAADAAACDARSCVCSGGLCKTCKDIHGANAHATSGIYSVAGATETVDVYCDMDLAGGGWTLVARSVANANVTAAFGWHSKTGSIADDTAPYALDVDQLMLAPASILFGSLSAQGGKSWGPRVYVAALPDTFLDADVANHIAITAANQGNDCAGGSMQSYIGFTTSMTTLFFFRDNGSNSELHGLKPNGWDANGQKNCDGGGYLDGTQGMIFIR